MSRLKKLDGKTFGRLSVTKISDYKGKSGEIHWECYCNCGNKEIIIVRGYRLTSGKTKSCGCLQKDMVKQSNHKHGLSHTSIYHTWSTMKARCYNINNHRYVRYGGRGIRVCERWLYSFENFYADMGNKPLSELSIDRIDNNLHYSCGRCEECIKNGWKMNCRWATSKIQGRNTKNNVKLEYNGKILCLSEWAEIVNIDIATLSSRYKKGWTIEEILFLPVNCNNKHIQREKTIEFQGEVRTIK